MNILFTLCGRAGSKGFKNKNLKTFLDAPLSYYSLAAVQLYKERYCDDNIITVVNTDSLELGELITKKQHMLPVEFINRDTELGGDKVPKVAVIRDCLDKIEERSGVQFDVAVDLDITSPLRTVEDIHAAVEKKIERPDVDVVYSVTDSRRNPYFNMVKDDGDFFSKALPSTFTTRQEAPTFYDMNASIYAYSVKALKQKDSVTFFNDHCSAIIMKDTGILDIDCEEDFELMQVVAKYLYKKYPRYGEIAEMAVKIKESELNS